MATPLRCSVIIATLDRVDSLRLVLQCLARQTQLPDEAVISAAGHSAPVQELVDRLALPFPARVLASHEKSAARQRNLAAAAVTGEVLAFLDDDIEFGPDLFAGVLAEFAVPDAGPLGAASPRISNTDRQPPGRLTRLYYRIQAGYSHADFGGRLFGPGINCFPIFPAEGPRRVAVDWLPSTCLFIRADLFRRHHFPSFTGYSYAEDVHLTARVARDAPLFFLRTPSVVHHSLPSEFKADRAALTAGKLHNMAVVAREVQGLAGWSLWWRWQLHRLFMLAVLTARRPAGWREEFAGVLAAQP